MLCLPGNQEYGGYILNVFKHHSQSVRQTELKDCRYQGNIWGLRIAIHSILIFINRSSTINILKIFRPHLLGWGENFVEWGLGLQGDMKFIQFSSFDFIRVEQKVILMTVGFWKL